MTSLPRLSSLFTRFCCLLALMLTIPLPTAQAAGCPANYAYHPRNGAYKPLSPGLIWQIMDGQSSEPDYVVGTFHSVNPKVLAILPKISSLFDRIDRLIMEVPMEVPETQAFLQRAIRLPDNQQLRDLLGEKDFADVVAALKPYQVPEEWANRLKPWVLFTMLSMPPEEAAGSDALDTLLERQARAESMPVHGLETIQEQLAVFDNMPQKDQITLLKDTLGDTHQMMEIMRTILNQYEAQDIEALANYSLKMMRMGSDPALLKRLEQDLIHTRNAHMIQRLLPWLKKGNNLIAVGALHLHGPTGILYQLEKQGYCLQPLPFNAPNTTPES